MPRLIIPDYTNFLLPPSVEDWVPQDDVVRFLREYVDQLDLNKFGVEAVDDASAGRPAYAPGLLLKIWLYGYLNKIRSSRDLERACRVEMPLIWLAGMQRPDHVTLWRFFEEHKTLIKNLFRQSVRVAVEAGLVGFELQALDGTKVQAMASTPTGLSKKRLEKILKALDEEALRTTQAIEHAGAEQGGSSVHLPADVKEREQLRQKITEAMKHLEQIERAHYHPQEPEARRMKCELRNRFAYNAQVVVDEKAGIITAQQVDNGENDVGQLAPMIEEAQKNTGQKTALSLADSGYGSGRDLLAVKEADHEVIVPVQEGTPAKDKRFHAHHFSYDEKQQSVRCPENRELDFVRTMQQKGQRVKIFHCPHVDCPVRNLCSKDRRGRRIEIWPHTTAVQEQRQKLKDPQAQEKYARRREIVEKEFADIKEHRHFRRWTHWGLARVRTQWSMICLTHNLRILYRMWKPKLVKASAKSVQGQPGDSKGGRSRTFRPIRLLGWATECRITQRILGTLLTKSFSLLSYSYPRIVLA